MSPSKDDQIREFRHGNLGRLLTELAGDFQRRAIDALHELGFDDLRQTHNAVLIHLGLEGTRASVLAARAGITRQATGQLVDDLEQLGYVERVPDPNDGRAKLVKFTGRGRHLMTEGRKALLSIEAQYREILGDDNTEQLRSTLQSLAASLGIEMPH